MPRLVLLLLAASPAALGAQPDPGSYPTIETAPAAHYGEPPAPDRRPRSDTGWYAQAYGVSETEARRRMRLQHELAEEI